MIDRHCLQCGVFIKSGNAWRYQAVKRTGGWIHDTCLDMYNKHKKIIKKLVPKHPTYYNKYYSRNKSKMRTRQYIYYHTNAERLRKYQRDRYIRKHYHTETDNEFLVKTWPRWKTQGGWII